MTFKSILILDKGLYFKLTLVATVLLEVCHFWLADKYDNFYI